MSSCNMRDQYCFLSSSLSYLFIASYWIVFLLLNVGLSECLLFHIVAFDVADYDNYDQEEYSSPLPLSAATVISEAVPPSMLSSAVVASASSQSRPAHASSSTVASNSSSSSSPSMLSNTNNIHTYSTTQSTNCLAPSLPPIADYENSRGLGGSYDGTSPSTLVRTLQQPPKHFNGSESLLHQGNSTHASQKARHFGGAAKSMKDYLNENLVQLYNCKRTGVRYTPQQEKTIRIGMFLFNK